MKKLKDIAFAFFQSKRIDKATWIIIAMAVIYFGTHVAIFIIQRT